MRYLALFLHILFTSIFQKMYIPIFKANTVQETVYEASYIVPSTQYDRIEGPKFRRRHIQSLASGTEKCVKQTSSINIVLNTAAHRSK